MVVACFRNRQSAFNHSNIWIPCVRQIEWIFVTPRFHFVHHSADEARARHKFGFVLSWWDRIFGTYLNPASVPADDPLGLSYEASNLRLLLGLRPKKNLDAATPEVLQTRIASASSAIEH